MGHGEVQTFLRGEMLWVLFLNGDEMQLVDEKNIRHQPPFYKAAADAFIRMSKTVETYS